MPTGYTHGVQNGEITTLHDFAMICARAFGATITMRDDPMGKKIPEKFEASDYHPKQIKEAEERLEWLKSLTTEQTEQEAKAQYEKKVNDHREYLERVALESSRYRKMLAQVQGWYPPDELKGIKDFMNDQLTKSFEFDCVGVSSSRPADIKQLTGGEWLLREMENVSKDIDYHTKAYAEEVKLVDDRNNWLTMLRASLPEAI